MGEADHWWGAQNVCIHKRFVELLQVEFSLSQVSLPASVECGSSQT